MFDVFNIQGRPTPTLFETKGGGFVLFQRFARATASISGGSLFVAVKAVYNVTRTAKVAASVVASALVTPLVAVTGGSRTAKASVAWLTSTLAIVAKAVTGGTRTANVSTSFNASVFGVVVRYAAPPTAITARASSTFVSSSLA